MEKALPIYQVLPAIRAHLARAHTLVLQAPPGAGKSTALPLALLEEAWLEGRQIWMLEPRRLAAKSIAARMSALLGEEVGRTVGYQVRFERREGPSTRILVLTEGLFVRRLQHDPELRGVGLVIFDEFHERSLEADLGLLLCREVQAALREDLRILLMSATLEAEGLARFLRAPVVRAEGRQYPVEVRHLPKDPEGPLSEVVAAAVGRILREESGDVLVFLPGAAEIARVGRQLAEQHPGLKIAPLHGELPLAAQQAAILPDPQRRRVVLSTSIAETSLTIEDIRVVVDGGYTRRPRFDPRTGLTRLVTERVTRDVAEQRAGRAGRLGPGVCYRLYSLATLAHLRPERSPEILEADLAPLLLELRQWGVQDPLALDWLTPPPQGALRQAEELLEALGALASGRLTERGRRLLAWPTHPRLAHLLEEGRALGLGALAADLAALLEERDPWREAGADLTLRLEALQRWRAGQNPGADEALLGRIERLSRRWRAQLGVAPLKDPPDPLAVGRLLALAYPDRLAVLRPGERLRYRLVSGRGVRLSPNDPLAGAPWLAVAHLDAGVEEGRIFLAAPLEPEALLPLARTVEVVEWDEQRGVVAERQQRVGELVLFREALEPSLEQKGPLLCRVVRQKGLALLPWTEALRQWQARVESLRHWRPLEAWPNLSEAHLLETLEDWLLPWLSPVSRREDFARLPLEELLRGLVPWPLSERLEALAPTRLQVPSGARVRLTYFPDGRPPVLAVRIQELFGLAETPRINEGRTPVMLHLLSPAGRPVQITQDLRSFWENTYPEVRKELRGRYPKHPWPEDPWQARPYRP
ncbi:ATP-dependent helicase HrpB [Meiothermus sp. QL-1]|uniref:ATP-dependent helicase HrpB n=1 Tax=Meiothermus sp. QL-1 TaxID=2058095 RepID=UPI000E0C885B|nr:ATP-dependent helicase HrpB [Meiothermus sp. QL-1]RDI95256.1 ATP-dependent helicase HrpB [Meiothermus sp. QL-1]